MLKIQLPSDMVLNIALGAKAMLVIEFIGILPGKAGWLMGVYIIPLGVDIDIKMICGKMLGAINAILPDFLPVIIVIAVVIITVIAIMTIVFGMVMAAR